MGKHWRKRECLRSGKPHGRRYQKDVEWLEIGGIKECPGPDEDRGWPTCQTSTFRGARVILHVSDVITKRWPDFCHRYAHRDLARGHAAQSGLWADCNRGGAWRVGGSPPASLGKTTWTDRWRATGYNPCSRPRCTDVRAEWCAAHADDWTCRPAHWSISTRPVQGICSLVVELNKSMHDTVLSMKYKQILFIFSTNTNRCCSSDRLFETASCVFIQLNVEIEQKMNSILLQTINLYVVFCRIAVLYGQLSVMYNTINVVCLHGSLQMCIAGAMLAHLVNYSSSYLFWERACICYLMRSFIIMIYFQVTYIWLYVLSVCGWTSGVEPLWWHHW